MSIAERSRQSLPVADPRLICRDYGSKVVGEVTLDQVYGGARGIKSLVWEVRNMVKL